MVHDSSCSIELSMDSLEASASTSTMAIGKRSNRSLSLTDETESGEGKKSFYLRTNQDNNFCLSEGLSTTSVNSEPPLKSKNKVAFVQSAMDEYLNSHRHSLSSVMELIGISERNKNEVNNDVEIKAESESIEMKLDEVLEQQDLVDLVYFSEEDEETEYLEDAIYGNEEFYSENGNFKQKIYGDNQPRRYSHDTSPIYFTLSPIEENSEPSTGSSTLKDSNSKDYRYLQMYSSSCDPIPSEPFYLNVDEKYQTFPRSKQSSSSGKCQNLSKDYYNETTMYPLEPREVDPSAFSQLHAVDSQEELQEFLLLESECMGDQRDRGLASAFLESDENETEQSEDTLTIDKSGKKKYSQNGLR